MTIGGHLGHLGGIRKKKYEHEIRDSNGNPIFGSGGSGNIGGGGGSLGDTGGSMEPALIDAAGIAETMLSNSDIGPGGAGVTTYGWKMFEDEILDRLMREKDSQEILQKLIEGLHAAAKNNPEGVADLLRAHPALSDALSGAMLGEAGSWGGGGDGGGGSGGGGGGGAV